MRLQPVSLSLLTLNSAVMYLLRTMRLGNSAQVIIIILLSWIFLQSGLLRFESQCKTFHFYNLTRFLKQSVPLKKSRVWRLVHSKCHGIHGSFCKVEIRHPILFFFETFYKLSIKNFLLINNIIIIECKWFTNKVSSVTSIVKVYS